MDTRDSKTDLAASSNAAGGLWPSRAVLAVAAAGLLVIAAVLGLAWTALGPVVDDIAGVGDRRLPALELIQSARQRDLRAGMALRNALLMRSESLTHDEMESYRRLQALAEEDLDRLGAFELSPQAKQQLSRVRQTRLAMLQARQEAAGFVDTDPATMPFDSLSRRLQGGLDEYLLALRRLQELEGGEVSASVIDSHAGTQRVRSLVVLAVGLSAALLIYVLLSWRGAVLEALSRKDSEIAQLARQRDALIREVHHRIKNHLQGLLSLMDAQRVTGPGPASSLEALRGNVMALMALHGLQASRSEEHVSLRELLEQQVRLIAAGFPAASVRLSIDDRLDVALPGPQAVPVALILTELMVNAIKHGSGAPVEVIVDKVAGLPFVEVRNSTTASRPPSDLPGDADAHSKGNGLALVDVLAHGLGRVVRARGAAGEVLMRLEFDALAA